MLATNQKPFVLLEIQGKFTASPLIMANHFNNFFINITSDIIQNNGFQTGQLIQPTANQRPCILNFKPTSRGNIKHNPIYKTENFIRI